MTSNMLTAGIPILKAKGAKVHLSFGMDGLVPYSGGGENPGTDNVHQARALATRMAKNVEDWDLDGVDIFTWGQWEAWFDKFGQSAAFHYFVFKFLREELPPQKTISYTIQKTQARTAEISPWHPMTVTIAAAHQYMDYINIGEGGGNKIDLLIKELGVPAYKIGLLINYDREMDLQGIDYYVSVLKEHGYRGLSFFSVNKEHNEYRGEFLKYIAQIMYT